MLTRMGRYVRGRLGALKAVAGATGNGITTFFRRCREPMHPDHLPQIDARYWLAILLASVLGTVGGDFVSQSLGLGYIYGLPAMAAVFRKPRRSTPLAIVTTVPVYRIVLVRCPRSRDGNTARVRRETP